MLKGDSLEDSFSFLPRERGFKLASLNITSLPDLKNLPNFNHL